MGREAHVHLKPGRDKSVREGHPWIFSGSVARVDGSPDAPVARVFDAGGRPLGFGFHSPLSQIRVRMLGAGLGCADQAFFAARIAEAFALRRSVLPPETTGYRLLNAEGDGVPGWTVDRFGDVLVSQITAAGLEAVRTEAYEALRVALPECAVVQSNDVPVRRAEGLAFAGEEGSAGDPPPEARFAESGL